MSQDVSLASAEPHLATIEAVVAEAEVAIADTEAGGCGESG